MARRAFKAALLPLRATREAVAAAAVQCVRWPLQPIASLAATIEAHVPSWPSTAEDVDSDRNNKEAAQKAPALARPRRAPGLTVSTGRHAHARGCTCGLPAPAALVPWARLLGLGADTTEDDDDDERTLLSSTSALLEMGPPSVQALDKVRVHHALHPAATTHVGEHDDDERRWKLLRSREKFWAPLVLNASNGGVVGSVWWCAARGLWIEAWAYAFLLLASVALHVYRDWPHLPGRRAAPDPYWTDMVTRIDYAAAFNLCGAVWVYQSAYVGSVWLTQPVLYAGMLVLALLLAAARPDHMATNGFVATLAGMAVALPSMLAQAEAVDWTLLGAVFVVQNTAFLCLLALQYRTPYWIAHSAWHVLGSIGSFLMLWVRIAPPPATAVSVVAAARALGLW
jgi:hypothetical protein